MTYKLRAIRKEISEWDVDDSGEPTKRTGGSDDRILYYVIKDDEKTIASNIPGYEQAKKITDALDVVGYENTGDELQDFFESEDEEKARAAEVLFAYGIYLTK